MITKLRNSPGGFDGTTPDAAIYTQDKLFKRAVVGAAASTAVVGRFSAEQLGLSFDVGMVSVRVDGTIDPDNDYVRVVAPSGVVRSTSAPNAATHHWLRVGPLDRVEILCPGGVAVEVTSTPVVDGSVLAVWAEVETAQATAPTQGPTGPEGPQGPEGDPGEPGVDGAAAPTFLHLTFRLPANDYSFALIIPATGTITRITATFDTEVGVTPQLVKLVDTNGPTLTVGSGTVEFTATAANISLPVTMGAVLMILFEDCLMDQYVTVLLAISAP
jgi:hypothetical protein